MNTYDWYKIFNLTEFITLEVVSKKYSLNLTGIGQSEFHVFIGNVASLSYLDELFPINMYSPALYEKNNYAVYRDDSTGDVYLGFLVE